MGTPSADRTYPRSDVSELLELSSTRKKILDAAADAFMELGYDATTIDEIAARIDATKGAVYYSYRSKMDIFCAVYERGMLHLEERVLDALVLNSGRSSLERLRAVCVAHAHNIMDRYAYHVVIQNGVEQRRQMALKEGDRHRLRQLDSMRDSHETLVHSLLASGGQDNSIREIPARLATRTLIAAIVGVAIWYQPRSEQSDDERLKLAEQVVDLLLTGVIPR